MLQHTHALINSTILFLLLATLGFAQCNSYEEQSPEKRREELEAYKIAQADSAKKYITAEYCLKYESSWKLLLYKSIIPLTIKVQSKSYNYIGGISSHDLDWDIKSDYGRLMKSGSTTMGYNARKEWVKYKVDRNEEYNIYNEFKELYLNSSIEKTDTAKISTLFNQKKTLTWNLGFEIDYQKHNLSGTHNIYISGICTEEQLKKIDQNLKYPVNSVNPENRGSDNGQK